VADVHSIAAEEVGEVRSRCWVKPGSKSAPDGRRPISSAVKRAGEPSAGNRHARFEVAGLETNSEPPKRRAAGIWLILRPFDSLL
jgi:hypothetical protein